MSVITPAFDGERYLPDALRSLRAQDFGAWEHVVVDDGSRDGTRAVAEAAARADGRVRVLSQENRGVAAARNRGIEASDPGAPYVLFLDQDDVLEPDALSRLYAALETDPEAAAVFGAARRIGASGEVLAGRLRPLIFRAERAAAPGACRLSPSRTRRLGFRHVIALNPIPTPGMCLIRRSALRRLGAGFDQALAPCDDWDLWLRIALVEGEGRMPLRRIPEVVMGWRLHGANQSHQRGLMRQKRRQLFEGYVRRPDTADLARAVLPMALYGLDALFNRRLARRAVAAGHRGEAFRCLARAARADALRMISQVQLMTRHPGRPAAPGGVTLASGARP